MNIPTEIAILIVKLDPMETSLVGSMFHEFSIQEAVN
jgi:hypothetical protein